MMMQSHTCGFAAPEFTNLRWDGGSEIQAEFCTHHAVIQTIFINTAGRLAEKKQQKHVKREKPNNMM